MRVVRGLLLILLVIAVPVINLVAQEGPFSVYTNGKSPYPNPAAPFTSFSVPSPSFTNSVRLNQTLQNGKLMLSLDDAIALALENNLDLAIARYNLPIADTDILRTKSGASPAGVNTGIVQGTPGGTALSGAAASGSGAGGTSLAAGGAGTGIGGLVTSSLGAGPPVDTFDPSFTSGLSLQHASAPLAAATAINGFGVTGLPFQQQNTGTANFTYQQAFSTGTIFTAGLNNSRVTTNYSAKAYLNPSLAANTLFSFRQHLLQGFGVAPNNRFIRIARNNREISDVAFRLQVTTTVTQIENMYWNLVNAFEDVKAKQHALDLANHLLADNEKQVRIGTLAPIEVVRAQSQVASSSQDLIVSQTNLQLQQLLIKNALSRNLTDSQLMTAEVVPTDTMQVPAIETVVPTEDLIADALAHRPELAEANIDLTNRQINTKAAKNALLPTIDLVGSYGTAGMGGLAGPAVATPIPATGFGTALSSAFTNDYPTYMVGFNATIPIRNRSAQATQIRSQLEYRQAQMRVQQVSNQIRIEVRNAQIGVQQNRARVEAATKGRRLAQETMDAEQKKYALGASTTYNVLQTQQALATAESNLITAMAAYEQSKVEMDRATGLTLTRLGIQLSDAESGNVQRLPHVPGVVPASTVKPMIPSQSMVPASPQKAPSTPATVPPQS
jgi:outer membrane protein TolC